MIALVRPPTASLARCQVTFRERVPIDVALAQAQHAVFCDRLRALEVAVVQVPPAPDLPDAVFVEDTAVVLDEVAVLARPGAASRRDEVVAVAQALRRRRPLEEIRPPGTLDGGDVLRSNRRLFVGRSRRTNAAGVAGLRRIVEPLGYTVHEVPVERCLHLLSACSVVASGTVLVDPMLLDPASFDGYRVIPVPGGEPGGANTLRVGETVLVSRRYPDVRRLLEAERLDVQVVDISELEKAEGGVSCLALLVPE